MTEEKYFFERNVFSSNNYEFTFEYDETIIHELLKNKTSGKVLDLGCGEGGNSLHLAEKGFDVTCVDISKTAIKELSKEAKKRKLKIKTVVADLESFEFEEKYDVILALGVVHFFSEEIFDIYTCQAGRFAIAFLFCLPADIYFRKRGVNTHNTTYNFIGFISYSSIFRIRRRLYCYTDNIFTGNNIKIFFDDGF